MAAGALNNFSLLLQRSPNNVLRCNDFSESGAERVESLEKHKKHEEINMLKRVEQVAWMCSYRPQRRMPYPVEDLTGGLTNRESVPGIMLRELPTRICRML